MTEATSEKPRKWQQTDTLRYVMDAGFITNWTLAIDGGAHFGNWARMMAEKFERVIAFEPAHDNAEILRAAVAGDERADRITFYEKALMDQQCKVAVTVPPKRLSDQSRYCVVSDEGEVEAVSIDSLQIEDVGLIKLDLEGAEFLALQGAADTIRRYMPVLIVEIDRHGLRYGIEEEETIELIKSMRYRKVYASRPDQVFVA